MRSGSGGRATRVAILWGLSCCSCFCCWSATQLCSCSGVVGEVALACSTL